MNVLLVDASALAYRSHFAFARAPLRTTRGEETSLCFGFLTTLLRWLQRYEPGAAAVVFDPPGPKLRHGIDPAYKANRPPTPAALTRQQPRLLAALAALRLPVLEVAGWEADDVLATLARRFEARGDRVYVASGDKDFRQLISERVRQVRPAPPTGGADAEIGPAELRAEVGLGADQIVDVMALTGDSSDNIAGVAGVGERTAVALVREHGSLEALYAHLDSVGRPALRRRLEAGREKALRARELVRLVCDAPVGVDLGALAWPGADLAATRAVLGELELFGLLRSLPGEPVRARTDTRVRVAADAGDLEALARALAAAPVVAVGVETEPAGAVAGLAFACEPGSAWFVRLRAARAPEPHAQLSLLEVPDTGLAPDLVRRALAPALAARHALVVAADVKQAKHALARLDLPVAGACFDVRVAAHLLDATRRRYEIDALAQAYLDDSLEARRPDAGMAPARLALLAAREVEAAWRLHAVLDAALRRAGLDRLFAELEMPLLDVLVTMEKHGVHVDAGALDELARELRAREAALEARVHALAGRPFNLHSPPQLGQVLFGALKLPGGRRRRGGWSTDVDVLERLARDHEVARLVLEHRQLAKLRSTYAEALPRLVDPRTGRIHTSFHQVATSTGRLSSSDPNLQNIPVRSDLGRRIRAAFVPSHPDARLVSADYSQIELRLLAHVSADPALLSAFRAGGDVHRHTAARLAGCAPEAVTAEQRSAAKTVNFGVLYGMGPRALAERLGLSLEDARRFIEDYFARYPQVRRCTRELVERARRTGCATTLFGRRLPLPEIASADPARRAVAERVAVNAPIQGSAADVIKRAMVAVQARLDSEGMRSRMILQVHDELVFEAPASEVDLLAERVRAAMQGAADLLVPLVVEVGVGRSWAEAH